MLLDVFGQQNQQNSPTSPHRRGSWSSIALLVMFFSSLIVIAWVNISFAQTSEVPKAFDTDTSIVLPELGNTTKSDRPLLREISDLDVFDRSASELDSNGSIFNETGTIESESLQSNEREEPASIQNVWQFVQQSRRLAIPDNARITGYQKQYRDEALWISKILNRATPFVGHIVEALDQRYLPVELALLPAIESGYQPDVHSAEYAAGIWQIVPLTANDIGVERTTWFDGRADIVESTVAAMDYISYLNAEFHGDWPLTLAAYNAGPGRVRAAVRRNKADGLPTDFWALTLPRETQNYVPKFLALVDMIRRDDAAQLEIPDVPRGDGFEVVDFQRRVSVDKLATLTGIDERSLRNLNAGLVHGVTPPSGPHRVYVSKGQGQPLRQKLASLDPLNLYTLPATHRVTAGDTLGAIALRYSLSERQLQTMNALDDTRILIGQDLAVRTGGSASARNIEYVVTIGDTLSEIADRFSVRVGNIRDAEGDHLASDLIHPGVRLSIIVENEQAG